MTQPRNSLKLIAAGTVAAGALAMAGCAYGDPAVAQAPAADTNTISLAFDGVQPLANGYHYEGWAIIDGEPVSTGRFNVNSDGDFMDLDGRLIDASAFTAQGYDLSDAEAVVVTIEPPRDTNPAPSDAKYMGGPVIDGSATLSPMFDKALGDFGDIDGTYILATPTNGMGNNETAGVWFLNAPNGPESAKVASLELPTLPDAWVYEGWVVIDGTPVSTGKFTRASGADNFDLYSGSLKAPAFPGEDLLRNEPTGFDFPTPLTGDKVVISIEPRADDSPKPFALKPLAADIPVNAQPMTPYELDYKADMPSGEARIG